MPGGLGGWVIWNKTPPLAPLEITIEADERIAASGEVLVPLDEAALRADLETLLAGGIESLTVALFNSYVDDTHERRAAEIAREIAPDIPVSTSAAIMPEMYEYERTETTVVNAYVRPVVSRYVDNLRRELEIRMGEGTMLQILRSDGGLSSSQAAMDQPVNLLMSGPAGGVLRRHHRGGGHLPDQRPLCLRRCGQPSQRLVADIAVSIVRGRAVRTTARAADGGTASSTRSF